ncbi:hypothetical protein BCR43DRAFT_494319 [Syncephalastrum racemosum]|uniref:Uncharacterized protein n=1 Tax=Syncephalastrum racemosum TaxID=13706 RepID=A0A1X2H7S2_SYNRA|nr:hypothetical protein BCR43DRAFT_494319 [Syncephalastrum racemosum]
MTAKEMMDNIQNSAIYLASGVYIVEKKIVWEGEGNGYWVYMYKGSHEITMPKIITRADVVAFRVEATWVEEIGHAHASHHAWHTHSATVHAAAVHAATVHLLIRITIGLCAKIVHWLLAHHAAHHPGCIRLLTHHTATHHAATHHTRLLLHHHRIHHAATHHTPGCIRLLSHHPPHHAAATHHAAAHHARLLHHHWVHHAASAAHHLLLHHLLLHHLLLLLLGVIVVHWILHAHHHRRLLARHTVRCHSRSHPRCHPRSHTGHHRLLLHHAAVIIGIHGLLQSSCLAHFSFNGVKKSTPLGQRHFHHWRLLSLLRWRLGLRLLLRCRLRLLLLWDSLGLWSGRRDGDLLRLRLWRLLRNWYSARCLHGNYILCSCDLYVSLRETKRLNW